MIRRMIALCAGALTLVAFTALPAFADNDRDDRHHRRKPVIYEVSVNRDDTSVNVDHPIDTLTIRGKNLMSRRSRDETRVLLGAQGSLEILWDRSTETELVVQCYVEDPQFYCNDGDYKLTVAIVRPRTGMGTVFE